VSPDAGEVPEKLLFMHDCASLPGCEIYFKNHGAIAFCAGIHSGGNRSRPIYTARGSILCIARRAFMSIEKTGKPVLLPIGHSSPIYESPAGNNRERHTFFY
jgi:hypothetical protein